MALYVNKGTEELQAIIDNYQANHVQKFGEKPLDLKDRLVQKLKEQQEKNFNSVFGQLTPHDLANLIQLLDSTQEQQKSKPKMKKTKSVSEDKEQPQEKA